MFDASAGLLLENGLHKAFDTLDWSLYLKVGRITACRIIAAHKTQGKHVLRALFQSYCAGTLSATWKGNPARTLWALLRPT